MKSSDQITGYYTIKFVEGQSDIDFLKTAALNLKEGNHLDNDFDEKKWVCELWRREFETVDQYQNDESTKTQF